MAIYSSTLAWEIPWTEEPGGLQSMGSQKSQTRSSDFHFTSLTVLAVIYFVLNQNSVYFEYFLKEFFKHIFPSF